MKYETQKLMFSSMSGNGRTPKDLFDQLDKEFDFTTDVCADFNYPLKQPMFQLGFHGLTAPWKIFSNRNICYMNPPYGREISKWLAKASYERCHDVTTVALLPARTDTKWFWKYCADREIRFIKGRLRFEQYNGVAPFPSMIVVFKP